MRTLQILCLSILSICVSAQNDSFLQALAVGEYTPKSAETLYPMADSMHYATIVRNGQAVVKRDYRTGTTADTLYSIHQKNNGGVKQVKSLVWSGNDVRMLLKTDKGWFLYETKYKQIEPFTQQTEVQYPTFSPDGRMIAFASHENLYLKKLDFGTEIAITQDGELNRLSNGVGDRLYRQGFGVEKAFEWSPDSKLLAFVQFRIDSAFTKTTVKIYDVFYKTTKTIPLAGGDEQYILKIAWTPNSEQLAVATLNRFQNDLNIYLANPASTLTSPLFQESAPDYNYVDYRNLDFLKFLPDNQHFVMASEREGTRHLYQYTMNGLLKKQLPDTDLHIQSDKASYKNKERFRFSNSKSTPVNGWLLKPDGFDPSRKYPIVLLRLNALDSPVIDRRESGLELALANDGYVVACVEANKSVNQVQQAFNDLQEAIGYLSGLSFTDKNRIAVVGWGAGGYLTLRFANEGNTKATVAISPITDWKHYCRPIAERYLRSPQANPQGYKQAELQAPDLKSPLLLIHASDDKEISVNHTLNYTEQLIQSNKLFDMQLYPNTDEQYDNGNTRLHLYRKILDFLKKNL